MRVGDRVKEVVLARAAPGRKRRGEVVGTDPAAYDASVPDPAMRFRTMSGAQQSDEELLDSFYNCDPNGLGDLADRHDGR
jgi:hypothetical protein